MNRNKEIGKNSPRKIQNWIFLKKWFIINPKMLGLVYIPHAHLDTYTFSTLLTVVYFGDFLKPLGETGITLRIQTDLIQLLQWVASPSLARWKLPPSSGLASAVRAAACHHGAFDAYRCCSAAARGLWGRIPVITFRPALVWGGFRAGTNPATNPDSFPKMVFYIFLIFFFHLKMFYFFKLNIPAHYR